MILKSISIQNITNLKTQIIITRMLITHKKINRSQLAQADSHKMTSILSIN